MAALARDFSDRHFERGEDPGDEVVERLETLHGFPTNIPGKRTNSVFTYSARASSLCGTSKDVFRTTQNNSTIAS